MAELKKKEEDVTCDRLTLEVLVVDAAHELKVVERDREIQRII